MPHLKNTLHQNPYVFQTKLVKQYTNAGQVLFNHCYIHGGNPWVSTHAKPLLFPYSHPSPPKETQGFFPVPGIRLGKLVGDSERRVATESGNLELLSHDIRKNESSPPTG